MHSSRNKKQSKNLAESNGVCGSFPAEKQVETLAMLEEMFPAVERATLCSLIQEKHDLDSIVAELLQHQDDQNFTRYQLNDRSMEAVLHGVQTKPTSLSAPTYTAVTSWEQQGGQSSSPSFLSLQPKQGMKRKPYCPPTMNKEKAGPSPRLKSQPPDLVQSSSGTTLQQHLSSTSNNNIMCDSRVKHLKNILPAHNYDNANCSSTCYPQISNSISGEPDRSPVAGNIAAHPLGGANLPTPDDSSEETILKMLMEMFLPKLTMNDIAREYAYADGDGNVAAALLTALCTERALAEGVTNVAAIRHSLASSQGQPNTGNIMGDQQSVIANEQSTPAVEPETGDILGRCEGHASRHLGQFAVPELGKPPKTKMEQELPLAFSHLQLQEENTTSPCTELHPLPPLPTTGTKEAEDFLFSMVGEEHGVERSTIRDILDFYTGDSEKSLDAIMDIIKASEYPDDEGASVASSSEDVSPSSLPQDPSLKALLELCPQVDPASALAVLVAHDGDVQAAANGLLLAESDAATVRAQILGSERGLKEQAAISSLRQRFPSVDQEVLADVLAAANGDISMASEHLQSAGYAPWQPLQASSPAPPCLRSIMCVETLSQSPTKATPTRPRGARTSGSRSPGQRHIGSAWGEPALLFPEPTFYGSVPPMPPKSAPTSLEPPPTLFSSSEPAQARDPSGYSRKWEREGVGERQELRPGWKKTTRGRTFEQALEVEGSSTFERENKKSQEHFRLAQYYFQEANKEFSRGNKAAAHALVNQGKELQAQAKEERSKSSHNILAKRSMEHNNSLTLDLHQQYVEEALNRLALHIVACPTLGTIQTLIVITGHGRHSEKGVAKIKPAVLDYLRERNIKWTEINPGCISIEVEDIVKRKAQMPHGKG